MPYIYCGDNGSEPDYVVKLVRQYGSEKVLGHLTAVHKTNSKRRRCGAVVTAGHVNRACLELNGLLTASGAEDAPAK